MLIRNSVARETEIDSFKPIGAEELNFSGIDTSVVITEESAQVEENQNDSEEITDDEE